MFPIQTNQDFTISVLILEAGYIMEIELKVTLRIRIWVVIPNITHTQRKESCGESKLNHFGFRVEKATKKKIDTHRICQRYP